MNIHIDYTDSALEGEITLLLQPEDYKPQVDAEIRKQARSAQMPGFRKGKVPMSMVRKMVGASVLLEQLNKILSKELTAYIQEEKLEILGDPLPIPEKSSQDLDPKADKELTFTYAVGLSPKFELNLSEEGIDYQEIEVDEAFLNDQIEQHKDRFGEVENPEVVEKGDVLYGKVQEVDAEGNKVEEGFEKMLALNPMRVEKEEVFDAFVGTKLEEVKAFDLFSIADDDEKIAELAYMSVEELQALKGKQFQYELQKINRVIPAELNAEFFKKSLEAAGMYLDPEDRTLIPEDEEIDEAAYRTQFTDLLTKGLEAESSRAFKEGIRELLMERHQLELPDPFLKEWLKQSNSQEELTDAQVEEGYADFQKGLTWTIISNKIREAYPDTVVNPEEVEVKMRELIRANMPGVTPEQEEQYLQHLGQDRKMMQGQYERMADEKLFAVLEDKFTKVMSSITATEFMKQNQPEQ